MTARAIIHGLLTRLPEEFENARFFRRNVGRILLGDRMVAFGLKGQADLWGIVNGKHCEIEVKAPGDYLSKEQKSWLAMIERMGGISLVARDVEGTIKELRDAVNK